MTKTADDHNDNKYAPAAPKPGAVAKSESAAGKALSAIDANPVVALIGGLAIGAVAGALLPRGARESDLLRPVGRRIGGATRAAIDAATAAGKEALDDGGLNRDALRQQTGKIVEQVLKAAGAAGTAAIGAARDTPR